MDRQTRAYLHGGVAVLLWSTVASAFKLSLRALAPAELLLYAAATSTLVLFGALALQGKIVLLRRTTRRDLGRSALAGLLNPFLYYLILLRAYDLLPGQEAQPLNYTWALVLPLLSVPLLGQRLRPISVLALLTSLAGVYVVATRGQLLAVRFDQPLGVGLALGSSILWALYWIVNLRDRRDEGVRLALGFGTGTLYALVFTLVTRQLRWPPPGALAGAVYVGCFEMGVTFLVWLRALTLSRTTAQVSNLIFLAPFLSLVLLHRLVGEAIRASSIIGLALIVAGILVQRRWGGPPLGGSPRTAEPGPPD